MVEELEELNACIESMVAFKLATDNNHALIVASIDQLKATLQSILLQVASIQSTLTEQLTGIEDPKEIDVGAVELNSLLSYSADVSTSQVSADLSKDSYLL